jgi:cleavage and polyadenylation specificity factor subunit 1
VTSTDVRLLKDIDQLCRVALDMGGGVRCCDITDPYILVLLNDGTVAQLCLQGEGLQLTWPELNKGSKVTLISAYTDASGLFLTEAEGAESVGVANNAGPRLSVDDEDELLYGDVDLLTAKIGNKASQDPPPVVTREKKTTPTNSNWCAVYREDGSLEIYKVPEFRKVFGVRNFSSCPRTLKDSGPLSSE